MENPEITSEGYHHGELLYQKNYKHACFVRDGLKCRVCQSEKNLRCHHVKPKSEGGTERLSNLMTLCQRCHDKHHKEGLKLPEQKSSFYISAAHVQQGKNYLRQELAHIARVMITYGFITAYYRNEGGLEKSPVNDAVIIAHRHGRGDKSYIKTTCVQSRKRREP